MRCKKIYMDQKKIDELLKIVLVALACPLCLPLVIEKPKGIKCKVTKIKRCKK